MLKAAVSLWSADLVNLASEIRRVEPSAVPAAKPFTPEVPLTRREQDVLDELLQGHPTGRSAATCSSARTP